MAALRPDFDSPGVPTVFSSFFSSLRPHAIFKLPFRAALALAPCIRILLRSSAIRRRRYQGGVTLRARPRTPNWRKCPISLGQQSDADEISDLLSATPTRPSPLRPPPADRPAAAHRRHPPTTRA